MIRGLRAYVWLQEAKRRGQANEYFYNCRRCMTDRHPDGRLVNPPEARQHMGCGYEPPHPRIPPSAWDGSSLGRVPQPDEFGEDGKELHPVCAGYVCGLPEVVEATHAHFFLKNGGLLQWTDGEPPTPAIKQAVVEVESEYNRVMEWSTKNPPPKAGG